ncbi:conserved hypothetical protein [Theileria equi strain WA]|uniref:SET domain-containing protein n=1 Tax=Theileria equi strain WA TaxID=1537102 RepID=L1LD07_THEEQ|nr:conserved hypothetical protein [Theileria equi strain WA]EKX73221.1 conserved hypothetical protein [Theileria equi strain WA]|eukprot:XP_004832673.1 conserved hypothetical protein [Theileria equi strain WA]
MIIDDNVAKRTFINSQRGYGIVFKKDLEADGFQLIEKPLLSFLHFYSKKCSLICDCCHRGVGSLLDNINHILEITRRNIDPKIEDILLRNDIFNQNLYGHPYIKCPFNCGTVYCSKKCLDSSNGVHSLLCGNIDYITQEKWSLFKRHAIKNHENFYFAGLVYVRIIFDAINGKPIKVWLDKLAEFYSKPWDTLSSSLECTDYPPKNRLELVIESFQLLGAALKHFEEDLEDSGKEELFSIGFYLRLLGTMDLVCVDIEIPSPLNKIILDLYNRNREEIQAILHELQNVIAIIRGETISMNEIEKCIESMELFPDIIGLGIFDNISKMNHSCRPNVEIDYVDDNTARINLLCNISAGQEATISYINEEDVFEIRQKKLSTNYGFQCDCNKCLEEESQGAKSNP